MNNSGFIKRNTEDEGRALGAIIRSKNVGCGGGTYLLTAGGTAAEEEDAAATCTLLLAAVEAALPDELIASGRGGDALSVFEFELYL